LVDSLEILAQILQPHVFPLPPGSVAFHKLTAEELGVEEGVEEAITT
jgi:hypothetical protein